MVIGMAAQGTLPALPEPTDMVTLTPREGEYLVRGEILLDSQNHTQWGADVIARLFLPIHPTQAWSQITDYPRWVQFFPDITHSEILLERSDRGWKRLYQSASKNFLLFQAQVEIHLKVFEHCWGDRRSQIQFRMERGSFNDFSADLHLVPYQNGTLLSYRVKATPSIPVPSLLIQQAIRLDLPTNLEQMRHVLCHG